jgi:hypothetical protein
MQIQNSHPQYRPFKEHWAVGTFAGIPTDFTKDQLTNTQDLLDKSSTLPDTGLPASYNLQRNSPLLKPARFQDYALAAGKGAAGGAGVGLVGGLALTFLSEILEIATLGGLTASSAPGLVAAAAVGAAAGALIGPINEWETRSDYQTYGEILKGRLRPERDPQGHQQLVFYPNQNLEKPVALKPYAQAPIAPDRDVPKQWWDDAVPVRLS